LGILLISVNSKNPPLHIQRSIAKIPKSAYYTTINFRETVPKNDDNSALWGTLHRLQRAVAGIPDFKKSDYSPLTAVDVGSRDLRLRAVNAL